jgi:hypothetical protein
MTSLSSEPPSERQPWRVDPNGPTPRQLTFWSFYTTAHLLGSYHDLQAKTHRLRGMLAEGEFGAESREVLERFLNADVDDLTAIVVELRARGHSVALEG